MNLTITQPLKGLHRSVAVNDASHVGRLRRFVREQARSVDFSEETTEKAAIIATELATNLVKHTSKGGQVLICKICMDGLSGLEFISLDCGPGVHNPGRMLEDGHSTAGSPGTGLGAIRRLSHRFELHSQPGLGTVVFSQLLAKPPDRQFLQKKGGIAAVRCALAGEEKCGDDWAVADTDRGVVIMVADGLGHGPVAATASQAARKIFLENATSSPAEILRKLHDGLRHTRGAAVAIAEIDCQAEKIQYAGVGNISGSIVSPAGSQGCMSYNGTVGYQVRKIDQISYTFKRGNLLIMHSDGLKSKWNLSAYRDAFKSSPAVLSALLYRDFTRTTDDVTVVVARADYRKAAS
ncbi:MAG: SpoIIE family protein phosphatase [bacterium]